MEKQGKLLAAEHKGLFFVKLTGNVRVTLCETINQLLNRIFKRPDVTSVMVDITEAEGLDSTTLGLLAKLAIRARQKFSLVPIMLSRSGDTDRIVHIMGLDQVYRIVYNENDLLIQCTELSHAHDKAHDCHRKYLSLVLEAHQLLSTLSKDNRKKFRDLIESLQESGN